MKSVRTILAVLFPLVLLAAQAAAPAKSIDSGEIARMAVGILENYHYLHPAMDSGFSRRCLAGYLDDLDADHLFFTRKEIDEIMEAHGAGFAAEIRAGRMGEVYSVFDRFRERAEARMTKIEALLKTGTFDFSSNRTEELSREHSSWPENDFEADRLWRDRIEGELLDEKLDGTPMAECVRVVQEAYNQFRTELRGQSRPDVAAAALSALTHACDPHSDYLTKSGLENLNTDMQLTMVGIGVVVEPDGRGRAVKVVQVLPDSPAGRDGRLKAGDRIVAVAHENGEFVEISGMDFERVIEMLRARSGTRVRLKAVAARETDFSRRKLIDLVSRKIELTNEVARAEIVERPLAGGTTERLGWIQLASFYGDPENPGERSATRDMRRLLKQLSHEKIRGLVIDLRDNPGGELEEAVDIAGFFLGPVPIVQEKDAAGKIYVSKSEEKRIYDGAVVVLTNHLTASAAELFASALKDYGRAVVVGGYQPTYGKGSIQTVINLSEVLSPGRHRRGNEFGALDFTIGKFYRVNGASTQLRGIEPDLRLPSPEDLPDEGEGTLPNALVYDEIKPAQTGTVSAPPPISRLREASAPRVAAEPEFRWLAADFERAWTQTAGNSIPLNESLRRKEVEEEKTREKQREHERKTRNLPPEKIIPVVPRHGRAGTASKNAPEAATAAKDATPDPVRDESLNILSDLVRLTTGPVISDQ